MTESLSVETNPIPDDSWRWPLGKRHPDPSRSKAPFMIVGDDGPWGGVPLGGFGSGTIGRTPRGDFARWHLRVGWHTFRPLPACNFAVRFEVEDEPAESQVLYTGEPEDGRLACWQWRYPEGAGTYSALYPRAWYDYDRPDWPLWLRQEQFSPILPHNYRETSYPVGLFGWTATNRGDRPMTVTLLFSWQHPVGEAWRIGAPVETFNEVVRAETEQVPLLGVRLRNYAERVAEDWQGAFAIAAQGGPGIELSALSRFDLAGDGADLWDPFAGTGRLAESDPAANDREIGAAVAATFQLMPGEQRELRFGLAWDFPLMSFGTSQIQGEINSFFADHDEEEPLPPWYRRHTRFWGREGNNAWRIAQTGLTQYDHWREAITQWHTSIPNNRPGWYRGALFNELYFLADGGTAWADGRAGERLSPDDNAGHFAYLECFDYPYYATLDVRFYGSWALLLNWPRLEKRVMELFIPTVEQADPTEYVTAGAGMDAVRKVAGALPHDLGAPVDAPWDRPNAYTFQDINVWKDLNSKFVLLIHRNAVLTGDYGLLEAAWPAVQQAIAYLQRFDRDGDTLPENDNFPDQTYDTWTMKGLSAYCGGLWLAALLAAAQMAELLDDEDAAAHYRSLFEQGQARYEATLWNGRYYHFDTHGPHQDSIMADQLCGQWYSRACNLPNIVDPDRACTALQTIYEFNVMHFADGTRGAVNGMLPSGQIDEGSEQSQEVWTGTTYALAALMLHHGLDDEAWRTAWGVYHTTYQSKGLWFRTPEAWNRDGDHRAAMYMRPQAIWAIEHALRQRENHPLA